MALDLDRVAIFASWLTIVGDTIAVLYEQSQPPEKEDNGNESSDKKNKKNSWDYEEEDKCTGNGEEADYGLLGGFLSFLGDFTNAVVAQIQAYEEHDGNIPKYVQRGLIGGWLVVIGDILQLQAALEETASEQGKNILPFLQ